MLSYFFTVFSAIVLGLCFINSTLGIFSLIALIPFVWAIEKAEEIQAKSIGFVWGISFFSLLLWWLIPTISTYGNLPTPVSAIALLGLCSYLAIYPSLWAHLFKKLSFSNKLAPLLLALSGASFWIILEWIREFLFSGFPWGAIAYSLASYPILIQTADIWGPYGIGFLIVFYNLSIYLYLKGLKKNGLSTLKDGNFLALKITLILSAIFCFFYAEKGFDYKKENRLVVASVQGSIEQHLKWNPDLTLFTVKRYEDLTSKAKKQKSALKFVVWPETAMPFYFQEDSLIKKDLLSFAKKNSIYLLLGSPSYKYSQKGQIKYLNSAYLIGPKGVVIGKYDKQHLVPFGEYMPFGFITSWAKKYLPTAGDFIPGDFKGPIKTKDLSIGVMICFESIFPYISRQQVKSGAEILTVITNDAWFGKTPAPWQHANMAIFRAVETRRWLIRAANTGISRIISPEGEIMSETSLFKPQFIIATAEKISKNSLYVIYGPYWFIAINFLIVIIALGKKFVKERRKAA